MVYQHVSLMLTISGVGSKKEAEAKDIIEVSEEFVIL